MKVWSTRGGYSGMFGVVANVLWRGDVAPNTLTAYRQDIYQCTLYMCVYMLLWAKPDGRGWHSRRGWQEFVAYSFGDGSNRRGKSATTTPCFTQTRNSLGANTPVVVATCAQGCMIYRREDTGRRGNSRKQAGPLALFVLRVEHDVLSR